jgi:hypothetical protein
MICITNEVLKGSFDKGLVIKILISFATLNDAIHITGEAPNGTINYFQQSSSVRGLPIKASGIMPQIGDLEVRIFF